MIKIIHVITIILFFSIFIACSSTKSISTIVLDTYDAKTDLTTFEKSPLGSIKIPGKWTKTTYNELSKQYFFKNSDTILIAVAINLNSHYPFYSKGMTDNSFINEFYEWDSKFLADQIKGTRVILKNDTINHSIIWHLYNNENINSYYLFGIEKGKTFTIFITTAKWDESKKIKFLQTVYNNKIVLNCCN